MPVPKLRAVSYKLRAVSDGLRATDPPGLGPQSAVRSSQPAACSLQLAAFSLLLVALTGCAAMTGLKPYALSAVAQEGMLPPALPYREYDGVLHVHTRYSHDSQGSLDEVVEAARNEGLDFVILTEHNTLAPLREGKQGFHDGVLVLAGMEISAADGHLLALGVTEEIERHGRSAQDLINEVNRQGGIALIAHPAGSKSPWRNWEVTGIHGLEVYTLSDDMREGSPLFLALQAFLFPARPFYASRLSRPAQALKHWDRMLLRDGRRVGVGAVDAHEIHGLGMRIPPYRHTFQLARTHLLVSGERLGAEAVYEALRKAHAFVSIPLVGDARGFSFWAQQGGRAVGILGDEVALAPGLKLVAWAPAAGRMVLFKDGQEVASQMTQGWTVPVQGPGIYRLEVERHGKPWIFSNPIFVRRSKIEEAPLRGTFLDESINEEEVIP